MGRILAIDFGQKRTGIAVTDELQIIASGLTTVDTAELIPFLIDYTQKENVEKIITCFLRTGIKPEQIGVITPYESQRAFVVTLMKTRGSMQDDLYQVSNL